jgi:hypothetical protein
MGSRKLSLPLFIPQLFEILVRKLERLLPCGSQGLGILHGNWEVKETPSSLIR